MMHAKMLMQLAMLSCFVALYPSSVSGIKLRDIPELSVDEALRQSIDCTGLQTYANELQGTLDDIEDLDFVLEERLENVVKPFQETFTQKREELSSQVSEEDRNILLSRTSLIINGSTLGTRIQRLKQVGNVQDDSRIKVQNNCDDLQECFKALQEATASTGQVNSYTETFEPLTVQQIDDGVSLGIAIRGKRLAEANIEILDVDSQGRTLEAELYPGIRGALQTYGEIATSIKEIVDNVLVSVC